jgi:tetratricopeptide (TPR) repeat protein
MMALQAEPSWHRYLKTAQSSAPLDQLSDRQILQSMEEDLSAVVRDQPGHVQAHLQLAAIHMKMFDVASESSAMAMDVRQVRDAALASRFKSVAEMNQWLSRALGWRRCHLDAAAWHARRALASCPLRGEAYLYLSEISFLDGPSAPEKNACIHQALSVRPFDGAILFAAGQESVLAGDLARASELWRASFRAGSTHQERLLNALAGQIPAAALIDFLQPDLDGLLEIVGYWQKHPSGDNLSVALQRYAEVCELEAPARPPKKAIEVWIRGANAYRDLGRYGEAIRCLHAAGGCDPLCFDVRLLLGSCLLDSKDYEKAVAVLQWCVRQNPRNRAAQRELERAMDAQLRSAAAKANPEKQATPSISRNPSPGPSYLH